MADLVRAVTDDQRRVAFIAAHDAAGELHPGFVHDTDDIARVEAPFHPEDSHREQAPPLFDQGALRAVVDDKRAARWRAERDPLLAPSHGPLAGQEAGADRIAPQNGGQNARLTTR